MPLFEVVVFVLFVTLVANDWLLARRLRNALVLGRFACPALEDFGVGGSPIRLLTNLWVVSQFEIGAWPGRSIPYVSPIETVTSFTYRGF